MTLSEKHRSKNDVRRKWDAAPIRVVSVLLMAFLLSGLLGSVALAEQTREQCEECCKKAGYDEYYEEQCRLKCFRSPDHCVGKSSTTVPPPDVKPEPEPEEQKPPPPRFRWPTPLTLVPGKEWEAAAHIVALNGVSPQHPRYSQAVQQVQRVLVDFARTHPQGGKLPTARLERILRNYR